jgi:hypothetical protein
VSRRSYPIAKSGIGSWTSEGDCSPKPRYAKSRHHKSRNPERIVSRPSQRTGGSRSKCHHFGISEFGISEVLLTKGHDTPRRKSRNPEKITAVHSFGHVARSRKPSASRLPGFQVDRGFGVASREIVKRRGPSILRGHVATI